MVRRSLCAALCAACFLAATSPLPAQGQETLVLRGDWRPWPDNGASVGQRSHHGWGETLAWAPVLQNGHSLIFADIRPKVLGEVERNAGIAGNDDVAVADLPPIWFGLDRRLSLRSNDFGGVLFAGERFAPDWAGRRENHPGRADAHLATASSMEAAGDTDEAEGIAILLLTRFDGAMLWGDDPAWAYRMPLEREGLARLATAERDEILLLALFVEGQRPVAGMPTAGKPAKQEAGPPLRPEWRVENRPAGHHGPQPAFDPGALYDHARNARTDAGADLPSETGFDLTDTVAAIPDHPDPLPPDGKCLINLGGVAGKIGFVEADGDTANCN